MGGDYEYCHCGLKSGYIIFNNLDPSSSRILDSATCRSMFLTFPWTDRTPRICLIAEIKLTASSSRISCSKTTIKALYLSVIPQHPQTLRPTIHQQIHHAHIRQELPVQLRVHGMMKVLKLHLNPLPLKILYLCIITALCAKDILGGPQLLAHIEHKVGFVAYKIIFTSSNNILLNLHKFKYQQENIVIEPS